MSLNDLWPHSRNLLTQVKNINKFRFHSKYLALKAPSSLLVVPEANFTVILAICLIRKLCTIGMIIFRVGDVKWSVKAIRNTTYIHYILLSKYRKTEDKASHWYWYSLDCYETAMVFRPYFGIRMFIRVYFSRSKGVSTTSF